MNLKACLAVAIVALAGCRIDLPPVVSPNQLTSKTIAATLEQSGVAVIEPGIFTNECVYGERSSISDHAPVIYGKTATWNITTLVNHRKAHTGRAAFYTHRFRVDDDGTLVDKNGQRIFPHEKSETAGTKESINEHYRNRLKLIAKKIKVLFARHKLEHMALQEIPLDTMDKGGNHLRTLFAKELAPELVFLPPAMPKSGERAPDTALVVKAPTQFVANDADTALRIQSFCNKAQRLCIASAHLRFTIGTSAIASMCQSIDAFVIKLARQGYGRVFVVGDFNIAANRLAKVCTRWAVAPIIKTTPGKGASCSNNRGGTSKKSIDLALEFNFMANTASLPK